MKRIVFAVLTMCLAFIGTINNAQAFRCGNEIVGTGDSAISLYNKCGRPSHKEFKVQTINGYSQGVENWYYNCGENDFNYVFTLLSGITGD